MNFLSKRKDNTYSIFNGGIMVTKFLPKNEVLAYAKNAKIELSPNIWDGENGKFITE